MSQLHKRFTSEQIKELLDRYRRKEIERKYLQEILGIGRRRFFEILKQYKENPSTFTLEYRRTKPSRGIPQEVENNILHELNLDKENIQNPEIPLRSYNYSYVKRSPSNPLSSGGLLTHDY